MIFKTIFSKIKFIALIPLLSSALCPLSSASEICGEKIQGEIMRGSAPDTKKIAFNGKNISISPDGDFLIAFGRDQQLKQMITLDNTKYSFNIAKQKWDLQNIRGIPQNKVTPSEKDQKEIDRERADMRKALAPVTDETFWKNGFIRPVEGRISGSFGGQRIMNGTPRNPHQGLDIAAPEGTPVKASGDGIISLAGYDYFYTGNIIVIDHGYNLSTIYVHMKDLNVKQGDKVRQGDIIGTVGKTGRVTGAHLHWGASLGNSRFDPRSLLGLNNRKNCFKL